MLKRNFIVSISLLCGSLAFAQNQNTSPYTRYGMGEEVSFMSTSYTGIAGSSVSLADFRHVNFFNPATYSSVMRYNPVFDFGVMGKTSILKTDSSSQNQTSVSLRNFSLLLPVSRKTGVVFGLMPYSTTGYDVNTYDPNNGDTITYNYSGSGSVNRLFLGFGQQLINKGDSVKLSIGVNTSFLFGTLQRQRSVIFQDDSYYNTRLLDKTIVRGFSFDLGIHYFEKLSDKFSYQLGITSSIGNKVRAYHDFFAYNYKINAYQAEVDKDTVENIVDSRGYLFLPKKMAIGASLIYNKKLTLSVQYEMADWQRYYEYFDSVETRFSELTQMRKFSFGAEYRPNLGLTGKNISSLKLMSYKLGVYYGYAPYKFSDIHFKQYGIAFGTNLPLLSSGTTSSMDLGFEIGKMGTTANGLVQDNYFRFNIGFSLSPNTKFDRWFRKRLYE
ncbi:MAG: hypothetical protein H6598_00880 [Flavobacteriales bacterium]|nr:hypothetical protein [Flavobacteriales bacterium]